MWEWERVGAADYHLSKGRRETEITLKGRRRGGTKGGGGGIKMVYD